MQDYSAFQDLAKMYLSEVEEDPRIALYDEIIEDLEYLIEELEERRDALRNLLS